MWTNIGLGTTGNVAGYTTMHTLIEGEMPTKKDLLDIALLALTFNVAGPSTNLFVKRVVHLSQDTNKTIKQTMRDIKNNPSKHGFLFDFKNRGEWLPTLNTKKRIETVELKIESLKQGNKRMTQTIDCIMNLYNEPIIKYKEFYNTITKILQERERLE